MVGWMVRKVRGAHQNMRCCTRGLTAATPDVRQKTYTPTQHKTTQYRAAQQSTEIISPYTSLPYPFSPFLKQEHSEVQYRTTQHNTPQSRILLHIA